MRLILLILMLPTCFSAQLLDNRGCAVFSGEPFFYTEFIRGNKIKSIIVIIVLVIMLLIYSPEIYPQK